MGDTIQISTALFYSFISKVSECRPVCKLIRTNQNT